MQKLIPPILRVARSSLIFLKYYIIESFPTLRNCTRAAPKVMSPILLCWLTTPETNIGVMEAKVEPSVQYSLHFVATRQMAAEGQSDTMVYEAQHSWKCGESKGMERSSSTEKKLHPLTFINTCWVFLETKQWMWTQWGSGWCISVLAAVTVGHLCCCRLLWVWHVGSCSSLVKMQS